MKKIVIYGTKYGTTKHYAEELAKQISSEIVSFEELENINDYEQIIYMGSILAGGIIGLSKTMKGIKDIDKKKVVIITVGISDPNDQKNTANLKKRIATQVPANVMTQTKIFHLRGAIDYSVLTKLHKHMLTKVYTEALSLEDETKAEEVNVFVETYNKKVSFVDLKTLEPIIKVISSDK